VAWITYLPEHDLKPVNFAATLHEVQRLSLDSSNFFPVFPDWDIFTLNAWANLANATQALWPAFENLPSIGILDYEIHIAHEGWHGWIFNKSNDAPTLSYSEHRWHLECANDTWHNGAAR